MPSKKASVRDFTRRQILLLILAWSIVIAMSVAWNILEMRRDILAQAQTEARAAFDKDQLYRQWAAGHGGVYIPATDDTPPSPYLSHINERDIETPSGRLLTLVNPAYMTRQVFEFKRKQYRVRGHITSLNPIRPENAPDPWERQALEAFEQDKSEVSSVEQMDGDSYLRLMWPMVTEKGCLKCHAAQGYKEGEIRGGVSVSVPMALYRASLLSHTARVVGGHILLWLLGIAGLSFGGRSILQRERARTEAEAEVQAKNEEQRHFSKQLKTLLEVGNALQREASFDNLCRCAVEQGRDRLGFPRLGIWFRDIEKGPYCMRGSFGISENGDLRDERAVRIMANDSPMGQVMAQRILVFVDNNYQLQNEAQEKVGVGTIVDAALWDGAEVIGVIAADDLLAPGSITDGQVEILTLFASTLGHLCSRIRNEEALRKRDQQYQSMLQSTMDGFWAMDSQGRITDVNETYCRMTGYEKQELLTMSIPDLEATESTEETIGHIQKIIETGYDRFETRHRCKGGKEIDVEVSTTYTPNFGGCFYAFVRDITGRKQIEAQLRQSQKMEAVGQLAGGVAHDFNNLLQVILGYGDMALDVIEEDSPIRASVGEMLKAGDRAKTLVSQLLAFSRRQMLDMKDVDLNDLVGDLIKMIRRVIGEHISLEVFPGHDIGIIRADPNAMGQILMNLCVNARDAMSNGGEITIETENVRIDKEYCDSHSWAKPGRYVLLSVTDTGCGMDDKTIGQIFEPFFTTKEVGKGSGLGLSTVYGLVKQHEGMIHVYSEVGTGTTFKIYFPLVKRSDTVVDDEIDAPAPGGTETILLAEDESSVRQLSQTLLYRRV